MIYTCIKFLDDYYRIDKMEKNGEHFFYLYSDPNDMNSPASEYGRSITRDCIVKMEYDELECCQTCNFYLGEFDDQGVFRSLVHFEENYLDAIFRYDDEENEIKSMLS